jgi:hypothetical protein
VLHAVGLVRVKCGRRSTEDCLVSGVQIWSPLANSRFMDGRDSLRGPIFETKCSIVVVGETVRCLAFIFPALNLMLQRLPCVSMVPFTYRPQTPSSWESREGLKQSIKTNIAELAVSSRSA